MLVVDELQRQAVDRRCCKKPSRLRNWSVCTPPTFTRRTASELITVHRPKPLLPSSGLFHESSFLHILDTQRICSVSLTTDSANLCRDYCRSIIEYSSQVFEPSFFQRGACNGNLRGPGAGAAAGDIYKKFLSFYFDFTQSSSTFCFFQRSDDTIRFRDSGAQHRLGRVLVFSAPRPRLGFVF